MAWLLVEYDLHILDLVVLLVMDLPPTIIEPFLDQASSTLTLPICKVVDISKCVVLKAFIHHFKSEL